VLDHLSNLIFNKHFVKELVKEIDFYRYMKLLLSEKFHFLIINKEEHIKRTFVKKDIDNGCDKKALKAVTRGYEFLYKPTMLGGNPVKVKFDVPFSYKLS
jgi:hypothetical protein